MSKQTAVSDGPEGRGWQRSRENTTPKPRSLSNGESPHTSQPVYIYLRNPSVDWQKLQKKKSKDNSLSRLFSRNSSSSDIKSLAQAESVRAAALASRRKSDSAISFCKSDTSTMPSSKLVPPDDLSLKSRSKINMSTVSRPHTSHESSKRTSTGTANIMPSKSGPSATQEESIPYLVIKVPCDNAESSLDAQEIVERFSIRSSENPAITERQIRAIGTKIAAWQCRGQGRYDYLIIKDTSSYPSATAQMHIENSKRRSRSADRNSSDREEIAFEGSAPIGSYWPDTNIPSAEDKRQSILKYLEQQEKYYDANAFRNSPSMEVPSRHASNGSSSSSDRRISSYSDFERYAPSSFDDYNDYNLPRRRKLNHWRRHYDGYNGYASPAFSRYISRAEPSYLCSYYDHPYPYERYSPVYDTYSAYSSDLHHDLSDYYQGQQRSPSIYSDTHNSFSPTEHIEKPLRRSPSREEVFVRRSPRPDPEPVVFQEERASPPRVNTTFTTKEIQRESSPVDRGPHLQHQDSGYESATTLKSLPPKRLSRATSEEITDGDSSPNEALQQVRVLQKSPSRWKTSSRLSFGDLDIIDTAPEPTASISSSSLGKRSLGRRVKEILKPRRTQTENAQDVQHASKKQWMVNRASTPEPDSDDTSTGSWGSRINPFASLDQSVNVNMTGSRDITLPDLDVAASKKGAPTYPSKRKLSKITAHELVASYLTKNAVDDGEKVKRIFLWIVESIGIGAPPEHARVADPFHGMTRAQADEMERSESIDEFIHRRWCSTSAGFARLFQDMIALAGLEDTRIIYGHLKGPRETSESFKRRNHAWNAGKCFQGFWEHANLTYTLVNLAGRYLFIDCYLASSHHPDNEGKLNRHWFLTSPRRFIYSHFPSSNPRFQFLSPPIPVEAYQELPYVTPAYFEHGLKIMWNEGTLLDLTDDEVAHLSLQVNEGIACYAELETRVRSVGEPTQPLTLKKRALAQCTYDEDGSRICKVKAILPPNCKSGWLHIYAGPRLDKSPRHSFRQNSPPYPLAMAILLTHKGTTAPAFDFVLPHLAPQEFYIQQPQCYTLFPLQTYNFRVLSMAGKYYKLGIRSPSGKVHKLTIQAADWSFEDHITISEVGTWDLVCLGDVIKGWVAVASWECAV